MAYGKHLWRVAKFQVSLRANSLPQQVMNDASHSNDSSKFRKVAESFLFMVAICLPSPEVSCGNLLTFSLQQLLIRYTTRSEWENICRELFPATTKEQTTFFCDAQISAASQ